MARLTPVLGLFLFMVPLLGNDRFSNNLAMLLVYFFIAWAVIILMTALVARALERQAAAEREEEPHG